MRLEKSFGPWIAYTCDSSSLIAGPLWLHVLAMNGIAIGKHLVFCFQFTQQRRGVTYYVKSGIEMKWACFSKTIYLFIFVIQVK